jgi:glycerol kinase
VILAIDQGTTGTTCLVFDQQVELIGRAYREFQQHFPRPGWVEHDAQEIWEVTQAVAGEALADAGLAVGELHGVGITNQRETVCVWDPRTGEPVHRAMRQGGAGSGDDPYARGTIVGLTRGATRANLARAALESIAYQAVDALDAMQAASGERLEQLRADGRALARARARVEA